MAPCAHYSAFRRLNPQRPVSVGLAIAEAALCYLMFSRLFTALGYVSDSQMWGLLPLSIAILHVNLVCFMGAYDDSALRRGLTSVSPPCQSWATLTVLVFMAFNASGVTLVWLLLWGLISLGALCTLRQLVALTLRRLGHSGMLARTVAIVDLSGAGPAFARRLQASSGGKLRLLGVFHPGIATVDRPDLGDLIELGKAFHLHDVIITADSTAAIDHAPELRRRLCEIQARVLLHAPIPLEQTLWPVTVSYGLGMFEIQRPPLNDVQRATKRLLDVAISSMLLVLLSPLLLIIGLGVTCTGPGPIIFTQRRYGFNNETISVHKFRTMRSAPAPNNEVVQATRSDPRITWFGRVLRRSSMDELPQLFDVFVGKMSLVGPRPHAVQHNEHYGRVIADYLGRHRVLPGITGLAQINGYRGQTDTLEKMERRIEYDLAYIATWSIWLDLRILLLTPIKGLFHPNAY